jgi:hypothetical protein
VRGKRMAVRANAELKAIIFDCDGVILESEDLHRRAYNAAFEHFSAQCNGASVVWSEEFYDELQNTGTLPHERMGVFSCSIVLKRSTNTSCAVGGGKPKMRWYFNREGWPTSDICNGVPSSEEDQATLIDTLQVLLQVQVLGSYIRIPAAQGCADESSSNPHATPAWPPASAS